MGPLKNYVSGAQQYGYDIIYTIGSVPTFIASQCFGAGGDACSNPTGWTNTCCPPTDVNADGSGTDATFKAFITALITNIGPGVIKYYELWNEQDSKNFWNGTIQQAVRMGQDAAAIIRSMDPTAQILSPSFHGPTASTFFVNYCTTVVNGIYGWQNFNIVNCHMYGFGVVGNQNPNVDPTNFYVPYNLTLEALGVLLNDGIDLTGYPLWDSEHADESQGGSGYPAVITDEYMMAGYVAVSSILRAAVGLSKQVYFQWNDQGIQALQSTPAGTAWNTVANILIGNRINGSIPNTGYSLGNNNYLASSVYTVTVNNGVGLFVWDQQQTCSAASGSEVCTYSSFAYPNGFTKWNDIFGNTGALSGGTVNIGCCPLYLH